jgi:hypothetical protein
LLLTPGKRERKASFAPSPIPCFNIVGGARRGLLRAALPALPVVLVVASPEKCGMLFKPFAGSCSKP